MKLCHFINTALQKSRVRPKLRCNGKQFVHCNKSVSVGGEGTQPRTSRGQALGG